MGKDGFNWLKYLIMAIGLLIILIIAMPILPWLAKGIVWIISLPFKAVAALCKGISSSAKKRREKRIPKRMDKVSSKKDAHRRFIGSTHCSKNINRNKTIHCIDRQDGGVHAYNAAFPARKFVVVQQNIFFDFPFVRICR